VNLFKLKITVDTKGTLCALCLEVDESVSHLFVTFWFVLWVWYRVFRWLWVGFSELFGVSLV